MRGSRALVLCGTSLFAFNNPALAQDQTADEASYNVENIIIVEARRRDESLQDVPLTVNAVTSETLSKLNIRKLDEITSVVPGLSLTPNANGIGSTSSMRGVNQDVNVSGENGTIQFYFNDAPVPSNLVLQAMYDIGQIEVLRGPQGTLRGRSTPSGSITIAPRKPDLSAVDATVATTLASHNTQNLQFGLNVPVISDMLAVRVAGMYDRNNANRIRSVNSDVDPRSETKSIRASARFEPTDWLRAGFVYEGLRYNSRSFDQVQSVSNFLPGYTPGLDLTLSPGASLLGPAYASPRLDNGTITPKDRLSTATEPRSVDQKFKFYGWNAAVDFAGQSLIYVGSRTDSTFGALTNQDVGVTFPSLSLFQDAVTFSKNNTHELRLQNIERVAGIFDYVVGYFRQTGSAEIVLAQSTALQLLVPTAFGYVSPPPGFPIPAAPFASTTPIYSPPSHSKEESFFGNVVAHIGEGTEISGGLRTIKFKNQTEGIFSSHAHRRRTRVVPALPPRDRPTTTTSTRRSITSAFAIGSTKT